VAERSHWRDQCWIDVGLPDERAIRKACGRADQVVVISYGRAANIWWNENRSKLQRLNNLTVLNLASETTLALAALASRNMQLQCTMQENDIMMTSAAGMIEIEPKVWQAASVRLTDDRKTLPLRPQRTTPPVAAVTTAALPHRMPQP